MADFAQILIRATDQTQGAFDSARRNVLGLQDSVGRLNGVLGALGVGLSVAGFATAIKGTIDLADHLNDLSHSTGIAVESLAALKLAAEQNGTDLDSLAGSLGKLAKTIGEATGGNKEAAAALKALGITARDPLQAFYQLADSVSKMKDPLLAAAPLSKALGKSFQDMLPLLTQGSETLRQAAIDAADFGQAMKLLAPDADKFNDQLTQLKINSAEFAASLLNDVLPPINQFFGGLKQFQTMSQIGVSWGPAFMAGLSPINTAAENLRNIQSTLAQVEANSKAAGEFDSKDVQDRIAKLKEMRAVLELMAHDEAAGPKKPPPGKDDSIARTYCIASGGTWANGKCTPESESPAKAMLQNALKEQEDAAQKEAQILASRNNVIDLYNQANLISIKDYFAARKNAQADALANQLADYDKEIAALQAFRANARKASEKAEATGKINDILSKKSKLEQDAANAGVEGAFKEMTAYKVLERSIADVNAEVLEMTGNFREAALIRFDQQNANLRTRFTAEGKTEAIAQLDRLREYAAAQADINKMNEQAGIINDQLANQESRITIERDSGAIGELESLRQLSAARQDSVDKLESIYEAQRRIAESSGNPKLIQDAENMRVAIEKLAAQADLVAKKFETIFIDSAANAFSEFATGAKTASEAFKDFTNSIVSEISRMAAQDLAKSIFGNISGNTGGLFGGGSGGFGIPGFLSSLFSGLFGGGKAEGGPLAPGKWYIAGEKGPEPIWGGGAGAFAMGYGGGQPMVVQNHFVLQAPADTRTQNQVAVMAGRGLQQALRRNG